MSRARKAARQASRCAAALSAAPCPGRPQPFADFPANLVSHLLISAFTRHRGLYLIDRLERIYTMKTMPWIAGALMLCLVATAPAFREPMTEADVHAAQEAWGQAIVKIDAAHLDPDIDAAQVARSVINRLYAFKHGGVLFKPTLATDPQFRLTTEDALSYFVTGHIAEDTGFALKPWTNVSFENAAIRIVGDVALAMGNYYFTDAEGNTIKVEYTFGYTRDDDGQMRIILQHSSLPFTPETSEPDAE
jgi:hypothetical protein